VSRPQLKRDSLGGHHHHEDVMLNTRVGVFGLSLLAMVSTVGAAQSRPRLTGTYTSMKVSSETGDVGGVLLSVYYGRAGFHAVMQWAEGVPDAPVLLPLEVRDSTISFTFPPNSEYGTGLKSFRGVVSQAGITGQFGNGHRVQLKRLSCS